MNQTGVTLIPLLSRILQMLESGLDHHLQAKYYPAISVQNLCKSLENNPGEQKLTLRNLSSAFLILVIGLALATGTFLLEVVYCYLISIHCKKTNRNTSSVSF